MPDETTEQVVTPSEDVTEVIEAPEEDATEQEQEDYKEKLNIQNRFLKKEGYEFKEGKWVKPEKVVNSKEPTTQQPQLSTADIIALSKVHEDDVERVERFAKSEGISVREALKNDELKAILSLREEQRTTASAANISTTRRSSAKLSDDVIVSNASNGKIPEDDDGIARLVAAKMKK